MWLDLPAVQAYQACQIDHVALEIQEVLEDRIFLVLQDFQVFLLDQTLLVDLWLLTIVHAYYNMIKIK